MKKFEDDIVLFGFGAVGQSALAVLEKEIFFDKNRITIIDKEPKPFELDYKYVQAELKPHCQSDFFSPYISKGGLLLDFTSEVDCLENIKWCYANGIMYLNTGDNEWPSRDWKNIYAHYLDNEAFFKDTKKDASTIIIHHGANPGSVSHFMKKGLHDIVQDLLLDDKTDLDKNKLKDLLYRKNWGELAEYLEVRTIHSSDRDNQIMKPESVGSKVFYSTWNPYIFFNECTAFGEARIGTTEKVVNLEMKHYDPKYGAIELKKRGTECFSRGWAPCGEYLGMIVGHEEVFSISDCLSVYKDDGSLRYRPTVYFTYRASDFAMESLRQTAIDSYKEPKNTSLVQKDIISGTEYVGVLIMGNKFKSRWVGNCLSLEWIDKNFPNLMPTILQVAISAIAAMSYLIDNRNKGINYPDDLPYEEILPIIEKYADKTISVTTDFSVEHNLSKDIFEKNIKDMFFDNNALIKAI